MEKLVEELFKINAVKFGNYKTKTGMDTPVYFDLRVIISYPSLMEILAEHMIEKIELTQSKLVCGVPYTALPIASVVSIKKNMPMVMRRKEAKSYGTKKLIEGVFTKGDTCVIIEDVVTSGSSILETVKDLRESGIICKDAIVLLDREQGGENFLAENGIKMHSLLSMTTLIKMLHVKELIDNQTLTKVNEYISNNKVTRDMVNPVKSDRLKMSFSERIKYAKNNVTKELLGIMVNKKTNLCIAADLSNTADILKLAEEVGPYICCLKTHVDIIEDFHLNFVENLKKIAKTHNFMLMEDRKFADIGKTVQLQYSKGIFQINTWAQLVTVHSLFGKGVLDAINEVNNQNRGVFLLAEASSSGCLIDDSYRDKTVKLSLEYENLVTGIVCQTPLFNNQPGILQLTPGVQIDKTGDNLGQQYTSPEAVIVEKGADIAVVGRGITQSKDSRKEAMKYRDQLWAAYKFRLES